MRFHYQGVLRASPHVSRVEAVKAIWQAPNDLEISISYPTRSSAANRKMHAVLGQLVKANVPYHGRRMTVENWKDLLAASLLTLNQIEENTVPTMDGNAYVVLGLHTSDMTPAQCGEVIERAYVIGAQHTPPVRFIEDIEPPMRRTA